MAEKEWEPKIVAFCCNWCSYGGADTAGMGRFQQPSSLRIIRVMCSGRIDPMHVFNAFLEGADAVLVTGCHLGDCHYVNGNYKAEVRYQFLEEMVKQLGLEPERLQLNWISASEGEKFANFVRDVTAKIKELGPSPLKPEGVNQMVEVGDRLLGYATDPNVRSKGASGGLVTAVLAAALEKGLVEGVVILKRIDEYEAVPVITDDVQEVLSSGGSMHAVPVNLAKYVVGKKVAMPGKPCDVRGVIEQAKRNSVDLSNTYIVGLNCGGSMHPVLTKEMLIKMYEIDPEDVVGEEIEKGKLIFKTKSGEEKSIPIDKLEEEGYGRRESCRYCDVKIPVSADLACGNWGVIGELAGSATFCEVMNEKGKLLLDTAIEAGYVEVHPADEKSISIREKVNSAMLKLGGEWKEKVFDEIPDKDRLKYFIDQFADCIDCGACKEVCPVCSCGPDSKCTMFHSLADNYKMSMYHMVRLLHLSDSCIGCGQCADVCPVDIPVTTIFRRFANPAQKKRNYVPGMDLKRPPFLEVMLK